MTCRWFGSPAALLMFGLVCPSMANAQAITDTQRFVAPFFVDDINPCTGEPVSLSGEVHIRVQTTVDSNGGFHGTFVLVPHQVVGEGASGLAYKAVGGHREHITDHAGGPGASTFTLTNTFNMVSQGSADNYWTSTVIHITLNSNGVATAETAINRLECRG